MGRNDNFIHWLSCSLHLWLQWQGLDPVWSCSITLGTVCRGKETVLIAQVKVKPEPHMKSLFVLLTYSNTRFSYWQRRKGESARKEYKSTLKPRTDKTDRKKQTDKYKQNGRKFIVFFLLYSLVTIQTFCALGICIGQGGYWGLGSNVDA